MKEYLISTSSLVIVSIVTFLLLSSLGLSNSLSFYISLGAGIVVSLIIEMTNNLGGKNDVEEKVRCAD